MALPMFVGALLLVVLAELIAKNHPGSLAALVLAVGELTLFSRVRRAGVYVTDEDYLLTVRNVLTIHDIPYGSITRVGPGYPLVSLGGFFPGRTGRRGSPRRTICVEYDHGDGRRRVARVMASQEFRRRVPKAFARSVAELAEFCRERGVPYDLRPFSHRPEDVGLAPAD